MTPQPWREDLGNALAIAQAWSDPAVLANPNGDPLHETQILGAFLSMARLVRAALAKLEGTER